LLARILTMIEIGCLNGSRVLILSIEGTVLNSSAPPFTCDRDSCYGFAHCIQYAAALGLLSMSQTEADELPFLPSYKTKQELAYQVLREAIITYRLPPKHQLLENELALQLGTSRSPIREALKRLAHEGLVNEVPHVGVTVAGPFSKRRSTRLACY
ncbi:MAG: GntR family transcriptional regulator, partial [Chloroflexi bacterium]|nr:GntR family transcriptional regulator [Chloroflexota bacterium]